jgi:hypothetical protein
MTLESEMPQSALLERSRAAPAAVDDLARPLCPLPAVTHPDMELIEGKVRSWAASETIFSNTAAALAAGYGRLAAHLYPRGDADKVALAGCILMYLFELDGDLVETPAIMGEPAISASQLLKWEAVFARPHDGSGPCTRDCAALLRLWQATSNICGPEHRVRLQLAWRTYAMGAAVEATFLAAKTMPLPAEYDLLRAYTIADWPLIWTGITGGYLLAEPVWSAPSIISFNQLVLRLLGISNDLWSYRKESAAADTAINYPAVLAHHHRCALAQALQMTRDLHQQLMDEFLTAREPLASASHALTRRYAEDVTNLVAGWHAWCAATTRYTNLLSA